MSTSTPREPDDVGPDRDQTSEPTELTAEERQEQLQAFNRREQDSAWRAVAYLLTGPLIYGGLGALADHWLGTSWLVGAGIVGGMALSLYLIWFRYGTH
ncbi:MAG TPA: AtpZ/AtpI family protein [Terrabacter sp.]|nr:AtpZ/AtpI family protein [Terrabacter sp.]